MCRIKPIAIYLPQFHPIPENDEWWGKGFTEWTNVVKAKPIYPGHYQPHLPADLGFYDLRLQEVREAQAQMAKAHGIYGFCYYHYWFNGKRLLERPVDEIVATGKPDFPFMLCWANENWSRTWDGNDQKILMKQEYSLEDARQHVNHLLQYFRDERYIRVENKPVFSIYKPYLIPQLKNWVAAFRDEARKAGLELYLCAFETMNSVSVNENGFDAAVEFQPHSSYLQDFMKENYKRTIKPISNKLYRRYLQYTGQEKKLEQLLHAAKFHLDYNDFVDYLLSRYKYPKDYLRFPGITPMWDNTARRGNKSFILKNANPEKYSEWLNYHIQNFNPNNQDENLLFINAWNEWAEGNHLEPCKKWNKQYLIATKMTLDKR